MHQTAVPNSIPTVLNVARVHALLAELAITYMTRLVLQHDAHMAPPKCCALHAPCCVTDGTGLKRMSTVLILPKLALISS